MTGNGDDDFEREYEKRAEEYYHRKTVHREEMLSGRGCVLALIGMVIFWLLIGWWIF